jgi:hypothetical protein
LELIRTSAPDLFVITRIDIIKIPFYLVWLMGLLELITVPLVVFVPSVTGTAMKNPLMGALIGFIGILLVFICINQVLSHVHLAVLDSRLSRIDVLMPAAWSGLLLCGIFVCQKVIMPTIHWCFPYREMVLGGFSAGGAVLCTGLLYQLITSWMPVFTLKIETAGEVLMVERLSLWRWMAVAAIYEAVALPIIWIWKIALSPDPRWSLLSGFAGGFAGGFALWVISRGASVSLGWIDIRRIKKPEDTVESH